MAMLFSVLPNVVTANSRTSEVSETDKKEISNEIEKLLDSRATVLVSGKRVLNENQFKSRSANIQEKKQQDQILEYRDELKDEGETYSSTRTNISILSNEQVSDEMVSVKVKEETYLTIVETGVETGYDAEHEFILEKDGNDWNIVEDRQLEPTGLLPLSVAEKYVEEDSSYFDAEEEEEDINSVEMEPASISKNSEETEAKNINARSGYNYKAMAKYLEKYWSNYNPAYRKFNGNGGDCTNFASQALRAGGWKDKPGWYRNANYWWYNSSNQTWSWSAVNSWATFARNSGRTSALKSVWDLSTGDVLQVKPKGAKQKKHTMMVSYVKNGIPYFTYHSSNRYRRSLKQVLKDWNNSTFYAYRT